MPLPFTRAIWLVLTLTITGSCKKEKAAEPGCDCQGPSTNVLKDAIAIRGLSGMRVLNTGNVQRPQLYARYCNPSFVAGKADVDETVCVSGPVRPPCVYGDFNYESHLEVTAIRRK